MYERPFYISENVSNNSFSFEKRAEPRIFVPSLIDGALEDVRLGEAVVFEDFDDDGVLRSCRGLRNFIKTLWRGKPVYVFDNHNHAFTFWHLEGMRGVPKNGATLIHMDRHKDSRKPARFLSPEEARDKAAVFEYTNSVLNVGNFIPAAVETGLVKKVVNIDSADSMENLDYSLIEGGHGEHHDLIFDLDLDFFAPEMDYLDNALKLRLIKNISEKSAMITIATSPFFIDPGLSLQWLRKIGGILGLR